jgi:F0F1-type ATP synthase epsilon subunit
MTMAGDNVRADIKSAVRKDIEDFRSGMAKGSLQKFMTELQEEQVTLTAKAGSLGSAARDKGAYLRELNHELHRKGYLNGAFEIAGIEVDKDNKPMLLKIHAGEAAQDIELKPNQTREIGFLNKGFNQLQKSQVSIVVSNFEREYKSDGSQSNQTFDFVNSMLFAQREYRDGGHPEAWQKFLHRLNKRLHEDGTLSANKMISGVHENGVIDYK